MDPAHDDAILAAIAAGHYDKACDLVARWYRDRLYTYCFHMLHDRALADDATQQTLLCVYRGVREYRRTAPICCWLLGIARNRCLDVIKASARKLKHFRPDSETPDLCSKQPAPDDELNTYEQNERLLACLQTLPDAVRTAVLLHYREGLSFEEMSKILGEKPGTLQARVARAMPLLRECLLSKGVTP